MKVNRNKIIFLICFLFAIFTIDFLFKNYFNRFSEYFIINDPTWCPMLARLEFFEFDGKFFLFVFIYNLVNINAALIYVFFDTIGQYLNGIIKLFYLDPRPFWDNRQLYPCICAINYGNPSTTTVNQFLLFALVYKIITQDRQRNKLVWFIICAIPVLAPAISRFLQNAHTLSQLLLGLGFGYAIYYFTFDICRIRLSGHRHLFLLLDNIYLVSIIIIFLYLFATLFHYSLNLNYKQEWLDLLMNHCEFTPILYFDNESYVKTSKIFLLMGSFLGLYLEYSFRFNSNFNNFFVYNVKDTSKFNLMFNNTNKTKHALRIILMTLIFYLVVKKLDDFPLDIKHEAYPKILLLVFIIPFILEGLVYFCLIKFIFSICNLTNDGIFEVTKHDLDSSIESLLHYTTSMTPSDGEKLNYLELDKQIDKEII
jgi:hypothetical protein